MIHRSGRCTAILTGVFTAIVLLSANLAGATTPVAVDTLVMVNGEPVTSADLDAMILAAHAEGSMGEMSVSRLSRLFEQTVNDRLMIQEAEALGLGEEYRVRSLLDEAYASDARGAYTRDNFSYQSEVTDAEIDENFETFYWKIQIRQLSVMSEQRVDSIRTAILAGAPMDSLASEFSVDTHSLRGGAHNLKYWADVEDVIRDVARDLDIDELSMPFRYRESYALIRVEARHPVDQEARATYESDIHVYLKSEKRKVEWRAYLDGLTALTTVTTAEAVLAQIDADSAMVIKDPFLAGSEQPVLSIGELHRDEFQVRQAISRKAMNDGLAAYATVRDRGLTDQRDKLVLYHAALAAGYGEDEGVLARHEKRRDKALVEAYLAEFIAPNIVFNRDEFQAVYDEYPDEFRGPDQVKLDTIILQDEQRAQAVAFRLREGADFEYIAEQNNDDPHISISRGAWATGSMFSENIIQQIAVMEIGDTSDPVAIPTGWLVFQLAGRRAGEVEPIEAVDMKIRRIMYQKKFNELLREHLKLLNERSEIVRNQDAIDKYFGG